MYYDVNANSIEAHNKTLSAMTADPEISSFLKSISKSPLTLVPNVATTNATAGQCHENVRQYVLQNGGKSVYGWAILTGEMLGGPKFAGITTAVFHCNWESDDGQLLNFTGPFYGPYQFFLPDPNRCWDFKREEGYNNRMSFHRSFTTRPGVSQPARNVTYFCSGEYQSRDKQYEKFRLLKDANELLEVLPDCWKVCVDGQMRISPDALEHITLKYTVSL
jgi:hypothetical protein